MGLGPAQNTHRDLADGSAHRLVARRLEKEIVEIGGGGAGGKRRVSCWWRDWRRGCGREKSDFVLVVGKEEDRGEEAEKVVKVYGGGHLGALPHTQAPGLTMRASWRLR